MNPSLTPDGTDLQAIVRGIPRPWVCARFLVLRFPDAGTGREFLRAIGAPSTIAAVAETRHPLQRFGMRAALPVVTTIAFTWRGLQRLGLRVDHLASFPAEFREGMRSRAELLGDIGSSHPDGWDRAWRGRVDAILGLHGQNDQQLLSHQLRVRQVARSRSSRTSIVGLQVAGRIVADRRTPVYFGDDSRHQPEDGALLEHFGFNDGVTNTAVHGIDDRDPEGNGKLDRGHWSALATGEFLLGHVDELGEMPLAPSPDRLARNGTYLVYRKLEQDVDGFRAYVAKIAGEYGVHPEYVAAKMVGRWRSGENLVDPWRVNGFTYEMDPKGTHCPLGAHIRRVNPRDTLGYETRLVSRHRILRRSFTYGAPLAMGESQARNRHGQGLLFMALNADIGRQFEFVQQQWVNFGNDLGQGDDRDPITGSNDGSGRMTIPADPDSGAPTVICANLPGFVRTRGGDYFFVPSLRAFRGIVEGEFSA